MKLSKWIPALLCAGTLLFSCTKEPGKDQEGLPGKDENGNPVGGTYDYFIYGVADIAVDTDEGLPVDSKENKDYRPCSVKVDGNGIFTDYDGRGKIRGRGNSTWEWYRKKPYRIKLDTSADFMSMPNNKDWVLLADYRDVTHMMNSTGFTLAHHLGIPYTNHSRYARLTLNGKYMGLYMVTEQVEEGGNRVAVDKEEGILLALDINDGPGDVPDATDNFWSEEYGMACAVKYPEDATKEITSYVKPILR
ncbi:MAG: CotH kinase family protein [Candidatus Cryptobacteroides sp.]